MKGVVEIYGTNAKGDRELILTKENLTVVGFAENIVDLLTTPSATAYPTAENAHILDASNYAIQAISTSKNKEHFRKNLHSYETSNLLNNTAFDETLDSSLSGWLTSNLTASTNSVDGYTDGVSGTLLQADTSGGLLLQRLYFNGGYGNTDGKFSRDILRYTDSVFSVDVKWNEDNPPAKLNDSSNNVYKSYSRLTYTAIGGEVSGEAYVEWDASGGATLSKSTATNFEAGLRYLGSKWYRVFVKAYNGTKAAGVNPGVCTIYPCNAATLENSDVVTDVDSSAGSIYIARPQLELGRHPTKYAEVSTYVQTRDDTLNFSILKQGSTNTHYNYYTASAGTGAYTLSGLYNNNLARALGVSAYIPSSTELTPAPHPEDRYLTPGAITPVEEALEVEILQGHNPYITNLSGTLMLSAYGSPWSYASGYSPAIGRHAGYLGAYAGRGGASRIYLNIVSALDYSGMEDPLDTMGGYLGEEEGGIGGNATLLDMFGYINLSDNGEMGISPPTPAQKAGFYKSISSDFSSTGQVDHVLQLGKGDVGKRGCDAPIVNLFGGVDTLGLWGMDIRAMRDADYSVTFPATYSVDGIASLGATSPTPKRRYKLYNKIVLTDNAVKNDGTGSDPGIFGNYSDIKIVWSLKFL